MESVLCFLPYWVIVFSSLSNDITCKYAQMEMQEFKEPILADIRNIQQEKAELEEVGKYVFLFVFCILSEFVLSLN